MKLSVVVPVYNEAATVSSAHRTGARTASVDNIDKEIIVVDDGSSDGTPRCPF